MPTYEYLCEGCGHRFDELQSFSEEPLKKCPACKKKKLRRLFGTGAAVLFKGSGFYETDYRSDSYKQAAKAEGEAAKSADGKTGTSDSGGASDTKSTPPAASEGGKGKKSPKSEG